MPDKSAPNILLILMDNLGFSDIGPYGAKDIQTPHLDRLAGEGVLLTQCYSNGAVCTPSRAALMTGLYPARVGLENPVVNPASPNGLSSSEVVSVARKLKDNNYATGLFGKWHLGYKPDQGPNAHGFDEFFGFLDFSIDYYSHTSLSGKPSLYENTEPVEQDGYITDLISDRAISFIERQADNPFFAFVSYNAPLPPRQRPDNPDDVRTAETWFNNDRGDYASVVERADQGIGRILNTLESSGVSENTIVIFTSDHGGNSEISDNGEFFHGFGTLWEGGIRVPCIVRWPDQIPAGTKCDQATIGTDLTASIIAASNSTPSYGRSLDGINVFPILAGDEPTLDRTFFWRISYPGRQQSAVRQGKWKFIADGSAGPAMSRLLFNLDEDVSERHNVGNRNPSVLDQLEKELHLWEADVDATSPKPDVQ